MEADNSSEDLSLFQAAFQSIISLIGYSGKKKILRESCRFFWH